MGTLHNPSAPRLSQSRGLQRVRLGALAVVVALSLAGCSGAPGFLGGGEEADKVETAPILPLLPAAREQKLARADTSSEVIDALMARRSVIPAGSPEAGVAEAVIAAEASPAGNELRAAVLRTEARDKNWLPNIDPRVSLAGLSTLAASVLADLVLFDNGSKKAERAYARADIDVAAVALTDSRNARIAEALSLQNALAEAEAKHKISEQALTRMREYHRVLAGRVGGGIDNPADLSDLDRALTALEADAQAEARTAEAARSQLGVLTANAMSAPPPPAGLRVPLSEDPALPVLAAMADKERAEAEAALARASLSPTLSAGAKGVGGGLTGGLNAGGSVMIFGRKAEIGAIEAQAKAAGDRVGTVREDTARRLVRYRDEAASNAASAVEADRVADQLTENHRIFDAQFEGGQRSLIDAAKLYVSVINQRKSAIGLRARARKAEIDLAREQGLLLDGERI